MYLGSPGWHKHILYLCFSFDVHSHGPSVLHGAAHRSSGCHVRLQPRSYDPPNEKSYACSTVVRSIRAYYGGQGPTLHVGRFRDIYPLQRSSFIRVPVYLPPGTTSTLSGVHILRTYEYGMIHQDLVNTQPWLGTIP